MLSHFLRAATVKESSAYEFSYLGFSTDTSNASTYTFSAQSLGDPHSKREIFVTCIGSVPTGTPTLASATIGGVSATLQTSYAVTNTSQVCFFAAVPSGTTGDIVLNFNSSFGNASIGVYRVINRPNKGNNATASGSGTGAGVTTVSLSTNITVQANGFLVGTVASTSVATVNSSSVFTVNGSSNIENYMGTTSYSRIGTTSISTNNTITFSTTESGRQAAWAFN